MEFMSVNKQLNVISLPIKGAVPDWVTVTWSEPGRYPGEPVPVTLPHGVDGRPVLLSVVLDTTFRTSSPLAFDTPDLSILARAEAPHAMPFGFHGGFARAHAGISS